MMDRYVILIPSTASLDYIYGLAFTDITELRSSEMEGETRKRKMNEEEERGMLKREVEEEPNEEEKMEQFFALIRSTKDIRDRMKGGGGNGSNKEREEDKGVAVGPPFWQPSFQPEDFADKNDAKDGTKAGPSKKEEEEQEQGKNKEHGGDGRSNDLDLTLSL